MTQSVPLESLVGDVDLLCLDAGNTVIFLDHARVARLCAAHGFATTADALVRAEGETKRALERGEGPDFVWSNADRPVVRGWGQTVGTMLACAGLPRERVPALLDALWPEHCARNLWSLVPAGLVDALGRARSAGVRIAVVSNSEGMLEALFAELGILGAFDLVVDSGVVGVEKPDPRIFRIALERFDVPPARAAPRRPLHDRRARSACRRRARGAGRPARASGRPPPRCAARARRARRGRRPGAHARRGRRRSTLTVVVDVDNVAVAVA